MTKAIERINSNITIQKPIPYVVYMTWEYKPLSVKVQANIDKLKAENPEFEFKIFDGNERREFIASNFDTSVIEAYDHLVPGAYKADLWRYCALYLNGGIYLDMDLKFINGFRLTSLMDNNEYFVKDINDQGIWNGFIVARAGNKRLLNAINMIISNVKNR